MRFARHGASIRYGTLIFMLSSLPACGSDSPSAPGSPPAGPASVTATLQVGAVSANAQLIPGSRRQLWQATFGMTWVNDGDSPADISNARIEFRHAGGRMATRAVNLAENTTVLPRDRLFFNYNYFYEADVGNANARITEATLLSDWLDPANFINASANTDPIPVQAGDSTADRRQCANSVNTLCLLNDRFKVEVDWQLGSTSGPATVASATFDTGTFWFFDANNLDVTIQVLDACNNNNHFWVFASATTNVEFTLTVTDTSAGLSRSYSNPLGTVPPPITDTQAFATCPGPVP